MKLHQFRLDKILKMDFCYPKPDDTLFIQLNHRSLNAELILFVKYVIQTEITKYSNRQSCLTLYEHQI